MKGIHAWTRKRILSAVVVVGMSIGIIGCQNEDDALRYRTFLKINQLKSSYYTEPKTGERYPLVQGSLSNLGGKTLIVVEFTLRYKNNVQHVIYEDHAYPIFVSEFAPAEANLALKPGAKTRFAFKAPKCPPDWQPGAVEVEITKIVFARNA